MKRFYWIFTFFCCFLLAGCDKTEKGEKIDDGSSFTLMNGSIIVTNSTNNTSIPSLNIFPEGIPTDADFYTNKEKMSLKSGGEGESQELITGNAYRFKLVAEIRNRHAAFRYEAFN